VRRVLTLVTLGIALSFGTVAMATVAATPAMAAKHKPKPKSKSKPKAPAASGSLPSCPSASVVNAALGQSDTGPVVSGTSTYKICTYPGSGPVPTKVSISENTPAGFKAGKQDVSNSGITVTTVPGLGDQNYLLSGAGEVFVLKGDTEVEVMAVGTTDAQVETLARQLI